MENNKSTTTTTTTTTVKDTTTSPAVVMNYSSTTPDPNTTQTSTTVKPTESLGLDSVQLIIIFVSIICGVVIIFLLLYYCVIRKMRPNPQPRLAQKSVSGSIGDGRDRNIFSNPEKQLAVDSSVRMNPNSPNSTSSAAADTEPSAAAKETLVPTQPPPPPVTLASQPSSRQGSQMGPSGKAAAESTPASRLNMRNQMQTARKSSTGQPTAPISQQQQQQQEASSSRKSKSSSKRRQQRPDPTNSVVGALAGLRDTLRESDGGQPR